MENKCMSLLINCRFENVRCIERKKNALINSNDDAYENHKSSGPSKKAKENHHVSHKSPQKSYRHDSCVQGYIRDNLNSSMTSRKRNRSKPSLYWDARYGKGFSVLTLDKWLYALPLLLLLYFNAKIGSSQIEIYLWNNNKNEQFQVSLLNDYHYFCMQLHINICKLSDALPVKPGPIKNV